MIQYVSTTLLDVAFLEDGPSNATAILLLHGWPDDATTRNKVMPQLVQAGYRVIAPWLRGFGTTTFLNKSSARTGNSGIIAFDAIALMDALTGSPSSAFVPGINPKSSGKAKPAGSVFLSINSSVSGSKAYLQWLPLGVSIMT